MLGPVDYRILLAFLQYGYLTPVQVTRLYYSKGNLTNVYTRLKALTEAGYLQRLLLPRRVQRGTLPSVYLLTRKGRAFLHTGELTVPHPIVLSRPKEHTYLFLTHTLAVNDFLIAADRLAREQEGIALADMRHELVLKTQPTRSRLPCSKTAHPVHRQ